ncbi:hypothetical protein [Cupriavidus pinatubonensis]|uniref:hypothetical protein n=1 Tax=Cupriavidus pinatubonensis TaxID=248026 RepID=UPI001129BD32|nr:hypothetical protein [Cupriavidus pinatubonensis]
MGYLLGECHVFLALLPRLRKAAIPGSLSLSQMQCQRAWRCSDAALQNPWNVRDGGVLHRISGPRPVRRKKGPGLWISVFDEIRAIFARPPVSSIDKNLENVAHETVSVITRGNRSFNEDGSESIQSNHQISPVSGSLVAYSPLIGG